MLRYVMLANTWTMPVWSLRLRKVRPPWSLWRATQPQRRTRLPTSLIDNWPQKPVRETQSRVVVVSLKGIDGLGGRVSVEAEVEKTTCLVFLGSGFEEWCLKMVWRRGRQGVERRVTRGRDLRRRRDMVFENGILG